MDIEKLFIEKVTLEEDFNYKTLYNDSRGAVHKDSYKSLIYHAIKKNVITVEKFIVAENVQDELYQISEETTDLKYTLIECLKDYNQESYFAIAPFIYLLRKLDTHFLLSANKGKLRIESKLDIEIRPRIDGKNATPRIFLPKQKIAIASTNDNVENLGDILAVKGVEVYVIGTYSRSNIIYAYKISRNDSFFEVADGYKEKIIGELFEKVRDKEV